jgi:hypothetical protein
MGGAANKRLNTLQKRKDNATGQACLFAMMTTKK